MSAQIITALRRRADALEAEGMHVFAHGEAPVSSSGRHPRSAGSLFFLAAEFRKLADDAEGRERPAGLDWE